MALDADRILAGANLPAIISSVTSLQQRGQEFVALCPFHDDHNPSPAVYKPKGNGHSKWQYKCWSCGAAGDAADFLKETQGLDFKAALERISGTEWQRRLEASPAQRAAQADRVTSKPPPDAGEPNMHIRALGDPSRTWAYRDADGGVLGYVARYDTDEGKQIRCWTWGARGTQSPAWGCGHWNRGERPLYGLDRLAERPEAPVLVVEGEKAADAAIDLLQTYYVVATWPGGAQAAKHADWKPLAGRTVLLWPDADQPGVECMDRIAGVLADPKGLGCDVAILDVLAAGENPTDEIPEGWDAANAQAEGWTTESVIEWARPRKRIYVAPQQNPAPQVAEPRAARPPSADNAQNEAPPPLASLPPAGAGPHTEAQDERGDVGPPPIEFPPDASPVRPPPRPRKPRLASVDGNLARELETDGEILPLALSESGVAAEFVAMHKDKFRCVHEWGSKHGPMWLAWTGTRWKREPNRVKAWQAADALARTLKYRQEANGLTHASKHKFETKKFVSSFLDYSGYSPEMIATPDQFDSDNLLLGTPAGPVDLRIGKLIEPDPSQYVTRQTTVAPSAGPHPLFDNVVNRACGDNDSMREYLWRWMGLFCAGVPVKAFLFLWGKRDSGKTTLIETVASILGKAQEGGYATTVDMELFTESRNDKGSDRLAHLYGARLVYASETEEGRHWKASLLKLVTGKDTLEGRFLYSEKFSFKPTHKLVIFGNERPHLKQKDEGVANRMHLVEYPGVIAPEDIDDKIDEKLVAEYPAILHSMIQGFLDFQLCNGLGKPEIVSDAVETYMDAEDDIGAWIDERIDRGEDKTPSGDAFRDYKTWAERNGAFPVSAKRFTSELEKRGFRRYRAGGVRYLVGFTLKLRQNHEPGYEIP